MNITSGISSRENSNQSELNFFKSRKELKIKIQNSELFWGSYCSAVEKKNINNFYTNINNSTYVEEKIKSIIEEIRKIFEKAFNQHSNFTLAPILLISQYYIREKSEEIIDLSNWLQNDQVVINNKLFDQHIRPYISELALMLNATATEKVFLQRYYWNTDKLFQSEDEIKGYEIRWNQNINFVFPIPKKEIYIKNDLIKSVFTIFENQNENFCEYILLTKNGPLKVPGIILYTCGPEILKITLDYIIKDKKEKVLNFEDFSLVTVNAFISFIILGEESLTIDIIIRDSIDVVELLVLADKYQLQTLVDCCTNFISLFSSPEDFENIKTIANCYSNDHLKRLVEHYKSL